MSPVMAPQGPTLSSPDALGTSGLKVDPWKQSYYSGPLAFPEMLLSARYCARGSLTYHILFNYTTTPVDSRVNRTREVQQLAQCHTASK